MGAARWVEGRLIGFDLETTGLDREAEEPVSFAFVTVDRRAEIDLESGWMRPNRAISHGASGVHGMTRRRLSSVNAIAHEEGLERIATLLAKASAARTPIVGTNLSYDLTMVDRCLGRATTSRSLASIGWCGPVLDVLVIDRAFDPDFKARPARKLEALCEHYGVLTESHTAVGDASSSVKILLAQAARFPELAAMSIEELYKRQSEWHRSWCDDLSAWRQSVDRRPLDVSESAWPYLERATLW